MIFRRFYSEAPKFDISSYVSRIQSISQNQRQKSLARAAKPDQTTAAKTGSTKSRPEQKKQPSRGQPKSEGLKPRQGASAGASKPSYAKSAKPANAKFREPGPRSGPRFQGAPSSATKAPRATLEASKAPADAAVVPETPLPPTSFTSTVIGGPLHTRAAFQRKPKAPHQKPKTKKRVVRPGQARVQVKRTPQQEQQIHSGLPLAYPAQETVQAVLASANSGFAEVDDMSPASIARDLVPGPTFNARLWSVINKSPANLSELVDRRVKGQFSLIKDDGSLSRVLDANPTLSGEHKQFLARVAAGQMPPAQVKQVRM